MTAGAHQCLREIAVQGFCFGFMLYWDISQIGHYSNLLVVFSEFTVPQVALMRAAQRSPRPAAEASAGNYQPLKSAATGSSLDPNAARQMPPSDTKPPVQESERNFDLEMGNGDKSRMLPPNEEKEVVEETLRKTSGSINDVDTWEEVEVPKFDQKDEGDTSSKRPLSPSQGSVYSRTQRYGKHDNLRHNNMTS